MPWQNQGGGGPWGGGGGGGGPWGGGPWGGGPRGPGGPGQTPSLEELVRRTQERLRRSMPGGFGGGSGIALIALAVLVIAAVVSSVYQVERDEQGVVMRFGRWVATTPPGLNFKFPYPIETVEKPKVARVNRIEVGLRGLADTGRVDPARGDVGRQVPEEALMLTGDENIVDINFVIFWRIADAGKYLFNVRSPEATIKAVGESAMREIIGQTPIASALAEGRGQIEAGAQRRLQEILDQYEAGVDIQQVQLLKVDPPAEVIDAFRDVQRARADAERLRNEAEAYRNDIIPRARGESERQLQEAEAYRQEVIARSQGDAQRFVNVFQAFRESKDVTAKRLYLETLEQVLRDSNKILIDKATGGSGVVPYLPLNELNRRVEPAPAAVAPAQPGGARR